MDKKIINKIVIWFVANCFFSCDSPLPNDCDYYYSNGTIGKIIEGSICADGTFSMETLIYPDVLRNNVEEYDDYILAYQIPDIDESYECFVLDSALNNNHKFIHYRDSINQRIDKIRKLKECYWIIQKRTKKVYGPLTKREYDKLCNKLDVEKKVNDGKHIEIYWTGR
jgi:hypothetical protein